LGEGIYPTPVLGIVGLLKTAAPVPTQFQGEGATIILLGGERPGTPEEFGSSQYAKTIVGKLWGIPPRLDMGYEKRVHDAMREVVSAGLAESAHDLSEGGLAVTLGECCTTEFGAKVTVASSGSTTQSLFGESPSRILVSTRNPKQILEIMSRHRIDGSVIGVTMKERLQIEDENHLLINVSTSALYDRAENALPELLHASR
jgi:phosphoribosylformylglycinamidine synthase